MAHLPPTHRPLTEAQRQAMRAQHDRDRGRRPDRAFYGSKAWKQARRAHLVAEPLCRVCAELGDVTAASEVDHILPRHVDHPERDLDDDNLQSLCRRHHSQKTMRELNDRRR